MDKSAGIIIILNNNKVLLSHPTNASWLKTYSFPKGGIELGESQIDAAIRELKEETSIEITEDRIIDKTPIVILYNDKRGKIYKELYLFKVYINDISEIGLIDETLPKEMLQIEELDWCGFLTKEEAKSKIFFRVEGLLNLID
jgi:8-oxo-dGTP pyrophosphatase MutT (NUDIX family)